MSNLFLRRATEYIRDDSAFLALVSPEALNAFVANHPKKSALFDLPVRVIGSPGSGKTMMASLVEIRRVETIARDQSNASNRELASALAASGFLQEGAPRVAAVRIPMEAEYRDFWELPYEEGVRTRLILSLIQARFILGLLRGLTANGRRTLADIRIEGREGSEASMDQIGGTNAEGLYQRAQEVERAVYHVGASLLPPELEDIPAAAREPYQPFETLSRVRILWREEDIELIPLVILDDAHTLHPDQFEALFRILVRREIRIARWVMMRLDALSPSDVFRSRSAESFPGLLRDRDYIDIFMQSESDREVDRRRFRKMAADMADKYLPLVRSLRARNYSEFAPLLTEEPPILLKRRLEELEGVVSGDQRRLRISDERRASLEQVVDRYVRGARSVDLGTDVRLAMLRILMHRYANRTKQPSLFEDPEPSRPIAAKSAIADGARFYLSDAFERPLHYGLQTLCDASNENAELFLQLSGALVERMETRVIQNRDPALEPALQQSVLKGRAKDMIQAWAFPYAAKVRRLVDRIAEACLEASREPNARLGAGANAAGILEGDIEVLLASESELAEVLKYAVAYSGLVAVRNYGQGGKLWCLLELPGPASLSYGLTQKRGGFVEWRVDMLAEIVEQD
ncbi:MAG: hypothetical protein EON59_01925 [Alphaproteobacteria bacterium]|nr:MAG: hypothetical protein EON59_01925 [Alphaproteobacteria bacterium]